jgi:hypothetical protein
MPKFKRRPLYRAEHKRIAWTLGLDTLPDLCAEGIVQLISEHHRALAFIKGHTVARAAATLRRVEDRMRRRHHGPETTREIMDPFFGNVDEETHERLHGIVGNPAVPLVR